eukprot:1187135-Amphidinium_carterae.1
MPILVQFVSTLGGGSIALPTLGRCIHTSRSGRWQFVVTVVALSMGRMESQLNSQFKRGKVLLGSPTAREQTNSEACIKHREVAPKTMTTQWSHDRSVNPQFSKAMRELCYDVSYQLVLTFSCDDTMNGLIGNCHIIMGGPKLLKGRS